MADIVLDDKYSLAELVADYGHANRAENDMGSLRWRGFFERDDHVFTDGACENENADAARLASTTRPPSVPLRLI